MFTAFIAIALVSTSHTGTESAPATSSSAGSVETDPAVTATALDWLKLTDAGEWAESWQQAGTMFHEGVTAAKWESQVEPVRQPLGSVQSRKLVTVQARKQLPGTPEGHYRLVQYATSFENAPATFETVVLAQESAGWKVVGYFIK